MSESSSNPIANQVATPSLTVAILTYNHERFIEQAVLSVLAQKTDFPIEIIVADDRSTDGTSQVLAQLEQTHPGKLTRLPRPQNLGLSANLQDCREQARGRYMAILEGDDYWTDPLKLQKQYDAMEANPDWSMCYTASRVFSHEGLREDIIKPPSPPENPLGVDDFLIENQVQTMSVAMYRQGVISKMPEWHSKIRIGDWALHILHANEGPIGFVPDVTTAYRVHKGGLWSGLSTFRQWEEMVALFSYLEQHFDGELSQKMKSARERLMSSFSDRVADLEKVEGRYLFLKLDRIAAVFRFFKTAFSR